MSGTTTMKLANLRKKLDLPDDATEAQVLAAADYLVAKADARQNGTVGTEPFRRAVGISDSEPERVVYAAADTIMLRQAKILGLSASTPPREIRVAAEAAERVAASQREARRVAASKPAATVAPTTTRRVAAATQRDLTGLYALNPLVSQSQVQSSSVYASAVDASGGSVPTLFRGGDLPAFTASGVDPSLLRELPWVARHAAAAEPDRALVLEMFEQLSGPDAVVLASEFEAHQGNKEYASRVMAWQQAGFDLSRERQEERAAEVAAAQQDEVRAAIGDPDDWTDEQVYEHLFGEVDQKAAGRKLADERAILEGRVVGHAMDVRKIRASVEARVAASGGRVPQSTSKSIDYSKIMKGGE